MRKTILVTQSLSDLNRQPRHIVFREYLHKVNKGDTLPRGKYFRGKKALGRLVVLQDEFWSIAPTLRQEMQARINR